MILKLRTFVGQVGQCWPTISARGHSRRPRNLSEMSQNIQKLLFHSMLVLIASICWASRDMLPHHFGTRPYAKDICKGNVETICSISPCFQFTRSNFPHDASPHRTPPWPTVTGWRGAGDGGRGGGGGTRMRPPDITVTW